MIRYQLRCKNEHLFEAWFGSISAYERQAEARQIACPVCGDMQVARAPMAPAVAKRAGADDRFAGQDQSDVKALVEERRALRRALTKDAENVGDGFAEEARRLYFSERDDKAIYGRARLGEAKALIEDGVPVLPLPPLPEDRD